MVVDVDDRRPGSFRRGAALLVRGALDQRGPKSHDPSEPVERGDSLGPGIFQRSAGADGSSEGHRGERPGGDPRGGESGPGFAGRWGCRSDVAWLDGERNLAAPGTGCCGEDVAGPWRRSELHEWRGNVVRLGPRRAWAGGGVARDRSEA